MSVNYLFPYTSFCFKASMIVENELNFLPILLSAFSQNKINRLPIAFLSKRKFWSVSINKLNTKYEQHFIG